MKGGNGCGSGLQVKIKLLVDKDRVKSFLAATVKKALEMKGGKGCGSGLQVKLKLLELA
jgi:hypothetical protein